MMLGYCFGKLFVQYEKHKEKRSSVAGDWCDRILYCSAIHKQYGDPDPWSTPRNAGVTFLSFMNLHKYPPSLLYMCATVGIGILFLALVGHKKNWLTRFITVYGRVAFLYYVLHFFLIHLVSAICFLARGHSYAEGLKMNPQVMPAKFIAAGEGYSLFAVYIIWI
jgi:uncharacterized membrane protein